MATLDIFNSDAFSLTNLTLALNNLPFVPGQVSKAGLFTVSGITTTTAMIEERNGSLAMIGDSPRGGPGEAVTTDLRNVRPVAVAHFQRDDAVNADEVQGVRSFGSESEVDTVSNLVMRKMERHTRDFDMTMEHLRLGALKGIVASKNRTLINCFTTFGVTAAADVSIPFSNATAKLRSIFKDLMVSIENDLEATNYSGLHVFCGYDFFKALIEHPTIRETYLYNQAASELRSEMGDSFTIFGVTFERYRMGGKATTAAGGTAFIAANEAIVAVKGVPDLFVEYYAPADYMETVNTVGVPRYAHQYAHPNGKSRHFEIQTNPIMLCTQPKVIRKLIAA